MEPNEMGKKLRATNRVEYYCFKCKMTTVGSGKSKLLCDEPDCALTKMPSGKKEFKERMEEMYNEIAALNEQNAVLASELRKQAVNANNLENF